MQGLWHRGESWEYTTSSTYVTLENYRQVLLYVDFLVKSSISFLHRRIMLRCYLRTALISGFTYPGALRAMLFGTGTSFSLAGKAATPEIAFTVMYSVIARAPLRCSDSQYLRIT
jgi:uncharacterized membrane protein YesL